MEVSIKLTANVVHVWEEEKREIVVLQNYMIGIVIKVDVIEDEVVRIIIIVKVTIKVINITTKENS